MNNILYTVLSFNDNEIVDVFETLDFLSAITELTKQITAIADSDFPSYKSDFDRVTMQAEIDR